MSNPCLFLNTDFLPSLLFFKAGAPATFGRFSWEGGWPHPGGVVVGGGVGWMGGEGVGGIS